MKIWVVENLDHGETSVYPADTDITQVSWIAEELSYLVGGYDDEREEFIADVHRAIRRGRGSARIEERIDARIVTMGSA